MLIVSYILWWRRRWEHGNWERIEVNEDLYFGSPLAKLLIISLGAIPSFTSNTKFVDLNDCNPFSQVIFKKQLSRRQWVSLIILTVGCIIKQLSTSKKKPTDVMTEPTTGVATVLSNISSVYTLLLLVQVRSGFITYHISTSFCLHHRLW